MLVVAQNQLMPLIQPVIYWLTKQTLKLFCGKNQKETQSKQHSLRPAVDCGFFQTLQVYGAFLSLSS